MIAITRKRKAVILGKTHYVAPFQVRAHWVEDANGKNVAECLTDDAAKYLANLLNTMHGA